MLPGKLQRGDSTSRMFDLWNCLIDYLQENRIVTGSGVSITKTPCGQVINAERQPAAVPAAPPPGHPFDVQLVTRGSAQSPSYSVCIYNSALPDSPYAGAVYVYEYQINVPVTELPVSSDTGFFVALDLNYVKNGNPPYSVALSIIPFGSGGQVEYTTYRIYIAEGKIPNAASRISDDIWVSGRWV